MMPADPDTLVLPAALSEVDEEAFAGTSAQKLVIPDTVTSVASRAFADCTGLLLVELPSDCNNAAVSPTMPSRARSHHDLRRPAGILRRTEFLGF